MDFLKVRYSVIGAAVALCWAISSVRTLQVDGYSMAPTLMPRDRLLVLTGAPLAARSGSIQAGDIVLFSRGGRRPLFLKRVVATPGDIVRVDGELVFVNGKPIVNDKHCRRGKAWGPIVVPRDEYFVLGDNIAASADSRIWGFISQSHIYGHALCIYWPYKNIRRLQ